MRNPTRRNRNIGTPYQGHGNNNKMVIPDTWHDFSIYTDRIKNYKVVNRDIGSERFTFLIEKTRVDSCHACTVDDVVKMLSFVPPDDLEELKLIIFRQPKRKEELLNPVWGRLRYFCEIDGKFRGPAIMIESVRLDQKMRYRKSMNPDEKKEFARILGDGYKYDEDRKDYIIHLSLDHVRNTQLYRTFLHEIGHYVQYLELVKRPVSDDEDKFSELDEKYDAIPLAEKEAFAHKYADNMRRVLEEKGLIPFTRLIDEEKLRQDDLEVDDFFISM